MYDQYTDTKQTLPFSIKDAPQSMHIYNPRLLSLEEQKKLNELKVQTVREDQYYLKTHPEIKIIINSFIKAVLDHNVYDEDIAEYAAYYFREFIDDLEEEISEYMKKEMVLPPKGRAPFGKQSRTSISTSIDTNLLSPLSSEDITSSTPSCSCEDVQFEYELKVCRSCFADANALLKPEEEGDISEHIRSKVSIEATSQKVKFPSNLNYPFFDKHSLTMKQIEQYFELRKETPGEIETLDLGRVRHFSATSFELDAYNAMTAGPCTGADEPLNEVVTVLTDNLEPLENITEKCSELNIDAENVHYTTPVSERSEHSKQNVIDESKLPNDA